MTQSEKALKAEVKRINTRISAIAKEFGLNSEMYKKITEMGTDKQTRKLIEKFTHVTNKGVLQVNTNLDSLRSENFEHVVNIARKKAPTISGIRKSLSLESKEVRKEQVIKAKEEELFINKTLSNKLQFLYKNYTDEESRKIIPEMYENDGELSYNQLNDAILKIERQRVIDELKKYVENEEIRNELIKQVENETDLSVLEQYKFEVPFS